MQDGLRNPKLILEEKKAIKLFIWLFYILFIAYEILYSILFPDAHNVIIGRPQTGLGYFYYIFILGIFPFAIHFIKIGNPYLVKYLYFFSYVVIDFIHTIIIYLGSSASFSSGHVIEVLLILFSPIFVNKKYLLTVLFGMIFKYIITGIVLLDTQVVWPIIIYIILASIAYIIFTRVNSYINALNLIHAELRQKEKLAVIGQMAAAIGHEIRNPLSSLKGFTQLQKELHPNTNDYYPIMIQEIDRIDSIVDDLMTLGKPKAIKFSKSNIEEIIAYTLSITQQQAERQGVSVETTIAGPLPPLDCDSKQLKQVFINLMKNAIEAMHDGGKLMIKVKVLEANKMFILVQDEGCGIDEVDLNNLGEPFFTTKQEGTGLGLMVTNQIIKDHNGEIYIESILGKGTKVNIILPIVQSEK